MTTKNPGGKVRRARQCLTGLLIAVVGAVTAPVVASATSSGPVATALGYNAPGGFTEGPTWVRLWDTSVKWSDLEPQQGQWDWTNLDQQVSAAESHRQKVILTLGEPPLWAVPQGSATFYDGKASTAAPASINDWNVYVSTVAMRYGNRIAAYEVWNEPNLHEFYSGTVAQLARLSRSAYGDLHKHVSNVVVLTPAFSQGGASWFSKFKADGGRYDAIAAHTYPRHPGDVGWVIENFRKVGGSKPIWMTEVGCNTNSSVGCSYSNPAQTGAFARTELHTIHMHNVPVALWYPYDGGGGPWMGFKNVSPYLLAYAN